MQSWIQLTLASRCRSQTEWHFALPTQLAELDEAARIELISQTIHYGTGRVALERLFHAHFTGHLGLVRPVHEVDQCYEFTLKYLLSSDGAKPDELLERLGAAGCTDALVGFGEPGCIALEFTRKAESLKDARESAIADIKRALRSATLHDDESK